MNTKLIRSKKYKAVTPDITINKIRDILKDIGVFVTETSAHLSEYDLYVFTTFITDGEIDKLVIGTNGKGMSVQYALASAYGEFMERLQTFFLLPKLPKPTMNFNDTDSNNFMQKLVEKGISLKYNIAPDEIVLNTKDKIDEWNEIFKILYNGEKDNLYSHLGNNKILCLPFYNLNSGKVQYLPAMLTDHNSNGFCAGNTNDEALIQGISEIFERYVFDKIFFEEITPPDIPIEIFEGHSIYSTIKKLESNCNLSITIKDCSLGIGLPVIGCLIIDKANNNYAFHLGADPSPVTALERTITEDVQVGFRKNMRSRFSNNFKRFSYKYNQKLYDYLESTLNYRGNWPNSIFKIKPSYSFKGFEYTKSVNDKNDLKYLLDKLFSLNINVFIRNSSFLGFPTFSIYVPELNDVIFKYMDKKKIILENRKNIKLYYNLIDINSELRNKFIKTLEKAYEYGDTFLMRFSGMLRFIIPSKNVELLHTLNADYLLSILYYNVNNLDKAIYYIDRYINREISNDIFLFCLRDFFLSLKEDNDKERITNYLLKYYNQETVNHVINNFWNSSEVLENEILPRCFNCSKCNIKENCRYFEILKYQKQIQSKAAEKNIDQNSVKDIINNVLVNSKISMEEEFIF